MQCPACHRKIDDESVWFCPHCDHVINLSFLDETLSGTTPDVDDHDPTNDSYDGYDHPPDAVILGDLELGEGDETAVISGVRRDSDGRMAPALLYASGNTSRVLQPDAVLELGERDVTTPNTPIENFILSCVNGTRTMRQIQRASGFALHEVTAAVLTLLDKRVVKVRPPAVEEEEEEEEEEKLVLPAAAEDEFAEEVHTERTRSPLARGEASRPKIVPEKNEKTAQDLEAIGTGDLEDTAGFEPLTELPADAFDEVDEWEKSEVSSEHPEDTESSLPAKQVSPPMPPPAPPTIEDLTPPPPGKKIEPAITAPARPSGLPKAVPISSKQNAPLLEIPNLATESSPKPPPPPRENSKPSVLNTEYLLELSAPSVRPQDPMSPIRTAEPKPMTIDRTLMPVVPVDPTPPPKTPAPQPKRAVSLRAPVLERSRSEADKKPVSSPSMSTRSAPPPPPPPPAASSTPPLPSQSSAPVSRKLDPDSDRAYRAKKLFDEAMKDKNAGDLMSAQMNVKLAISFDPGNAEFKRVLDEISKMVEAAGGKRGPSKRSAATELADQAQQAETTGDIDGAIKLLEKSLKSSKDAATYNRLGVILAMRKRDFERGREMIEKALEIAPNNETYQHNLSKILARAAEVDLARGSRSSSGGGGGGKKGLLGIFGKKK